MARSLGEWRAVLAPLIKKLAKPDHGAPRKKPTLGRNAKESALLALDAGNVEAFLAAFASSKKPGPTLEFVGVRVDNSRVSARYGQVLLGASDFLLAQKREHIRRFLPCMAITCARQLQHKVGANRARASDVAKRIRPLLADEPFEAELAGAWAGGLLEDKKWKEALDLYDIVLACKTMKRRYAFTKARSECARRVKTR